jgi:hypothetical protein
VNPSSLRDIKGAGVGAGASAALDGFALRKRLLVPRWWLEGVLFALGRSGSQVFVDSYLESLNAKMLMAGGSDPSRRCFVHAGSVTSPRLFGWMAHFWNALIRQLHHARLGADSEGFEGSEVRLSCEEIFRVAADPGPEARDDFSRMVMAPLESFVLESSALAPGARPQSRIGQRSGLGSGFVLRGQGATTTLAHGVRFSDDGRSVTVRLFRPPQDVVLCKDPGSESFLSGVFQDDGLVSLSPSVLRWFGESGSIKRLAGYFFVELTKSLASALDPDKSNVSADAALVLLPKLSQAAELMTEWGLRASGLYDHGVLGWASQVPQQRIATLRQQLPWASSHQCVHVVNVSKHLKDVVVFEREMWKSVSVAREALKARETRLAPVAPSRADPLTSRARRLRGLLRRHQQVFVSKDSEFQGRSMRPAHARRDVRDREMEYVLKLAQYYESLSPAQRRELDREMQMRSPAEFRAWLGPMLERTH